MAISEQPPPAATDLPATRFPYLGDFAGASWNTQALFARKRGRHDVKHHYVHRLMRGRDFVTLSDTHGLEGGTEVWARPLGCSAWFSPGTSRRGGVGIVVRDSFLRQFRAAPPRWLPIVPGRAAVLQLRGEAGALDIFSVYFATGTPGVIQPMGARRAGT